ncbi:MAG: T9SS type A sorting domain-containing protein [Flavobacteriales bacterium]
MIRYLFIVSVIAINHLFGQYNLVPNPSFEICTICPINIIGQIDNPLSTSNTLLPGWNNPNTASPDYFNPGFQAFEGDGYIGLGMFTHLLQGNDNLEREYLECELIDSLIFKKQYLIIFYVRVDSNFGNFFINNLGVYFTDTLIQTNTVNYIAAIPQIKYFKNEIINDSSYSWIKFSGIYESQGGEKFMTVGNFNSNLETAFYCSSPFFPASGFNYTHFDKFSITPLDSISGGLHVNAGQDYTICPGDTVFIGEKISNLPANWYLLDGTIVDTNTAGVYVHPTVTTSYVVTLNINGVYSADTVTVTVGCAGVDEPEKPKFSIGPNPNDGQFTLKGELSEGDVISIVSTDGRLIHSININQQTDVQLINLNLNTGTYLLEIENEFGRSIYRTSVVILEK